MKVRTLIELLETHDLEAEVYLYDAVCEEYFPTLAPEIRTVFKNDDANEVSTPHSIIALDPDQDATPLLNYEIYETPGEKEDNLGHTVEGVDVGDIAELDRQLAKAKLGQSIG